MIPAFKALSPATWIEGPSAIGSVNAMPSSIISAPASGSPAKIFAEVCKSGSPDIINVINAALLSALNLVKRASIRAVPVLISEIQGFLPR